MGREDGEELLAPLEARWRHTLRVVERARSFDDVLRAREFEVLTAAAYLPDMGCAPELAETEFHPLHGARFVRDAGHDRLAGAVVHHSASQAEAEERGLGEALAEFPAEDSLVARALTYCDLTTGPDGERVAVSARLAELGERLGKCRHFPKIAVQLKAKPNSKLLAPPFPIVSPTPFLRGK